MIRWLMLDDLKSDEGLDHQLLTRDDNALQRALDAAMSYVRDNRPDLDFTSAESVPPEVRLGTLRLAEHWSTRRPTDLGDLGSGSGGRIPADVLEMLGIRR